MSIQYLVTPKTIQYLCNTFRVNKIGKIYWWINTWNHLNLKENEILSQICEILLSEIACFWLHVLLRWILKVIIYLCQQESTHFNPDTFKLNLKRVFLLRCDNFQLLCLCLIHMQVARWEYRTHAITHWFGSAERGCYALAVVICLLGLFRDYR